MLTLEILREEISERGAEWQAEQTEIVGRIDPEAPGVGLFGLRISEAERRALLADASIEHRSTFAVQPPPPPAVDWRDNKNRNWVTPIKDQGGCGSCVSFATCAALESRAKIQTGNASLAIDLAEAHLFFCGAGPACSKGWNFVPAMVQCRDIGVGDESDFPYQDVDQPCQAIQALVKVPSWETAALMADRKRAVANGPAIAGMRVFEDFTYYGGGVYKHVAGDIIGLHAVAVVGYDDGDRCWIAKNSWGSAWGEGGFFRLGYGECGFDTDFVFFAPEVSYPLP